MTTQWLAVRTPQLWSNYRVKGSAGGKKKKTKTTKPDKKQISHSQNKLLILLKICKVTLTSSYIQERMSLIF